jgi:hypothetical protein
MRKLALVLLCVALGGCAQLQADWQKFTNAVAVGTASITNPVTKEREYQIENASMLVFSALKAWKDTCAKGLINSNCKAQIAAVQVYTKQIPPYLAQLRQFVDANDQVNAVSVFNTLTDLIATVKSQAASAGVSVGG